MKYSSLETNLRPQTSEKPWFLVLIFIVPLYFGIMELPSFADLNNFDPATTTLKREGNKLHVLTKLADNHVEEEVLDLEQVQPGAHFFHWLNSNERFSDIIQSGKILPEYMRFYTTVRNNAQTYGPGFYVSSDPFDSMGYGSQALTVKAPEPFWVITSPVRASTTEKARQTFDALQKVGIGGTKVSQTWYVLNDEKILSKVESFDLKAAVILLAQKGGLSDGTQLALKKWSNEQALNTADLLALYNPSVGLDGRQMPVLLNVLGNGLSKTKEDDIKILLRGLKTPVLETKNFYLPTNVSEAVLHAAGDDPELLDKSLILIKLTKNPSSQLLITLDRIFHDRPDAFSLIEHMDLNNPESKKGVLAITQRFMKENPSIRFEDYLGHSDGLGPLFKSAGISRSDIEGLEEQLKIRPPLPQGGPDCSAAYARIR